MMRKNTAGGFVSFWTSFFMCFIMILLLPAKSLPQEKSSAQGTNVQQAGTPRDGQHDFDFNIGTWKTHLKRLVSPLTGSTTWVEYEGTSVVRKVLGGRANLVELEVEGPSGRIDGMLLRLYNPQSRQWSLNYSTATGGTLFEPMYGEFKEGRGEFFGLESMNGRAILIRFVVTPFTPDSCRFEQSFSDDGGKTWELNWIATDVRVKR